MHLSISFKARIEIRIQYMIFKKNSNFPKEAKYSKDLGAGRSIFVVEIRSLKMTVCLLLIFKR